MKTFKPLLVALALAASAPFAISAHAQAMDHSEMSGMNMPGMKMDGVPALMTEGEVRKIDKEAKKITLKHGDIKNLDMPGMTMVFQVKDAALLDLSLIHIWPCTVSCHRRVSTDGAGNVTSVTKNRSTGVKSSDSPGIRGAAVRGGGTSVGRISGCLVRCRRRSRRIANASTASASPRVREATAPSQTPSNPAPIASDPRGNAILRGSSTRRHNA